MKHSKPFEAYNLHVPNSLFDRLVQDIPVEAWTRLIQKNPTLKEAVLEGFSGRPHKIPRLIRQPQVTQRLRRILQSDETFFDLILHVWGQEQIAIAAFMEMLDSDYLLYHWTGLKKLLGPERFFAALCLLGHIHSEEVRDQIAEDFWEREMDDEAAEPLIPALTIWSAFVREHPEAKEWLEIEALAIPLTTSSIPSSSVSLPASSPTTPHEGPETHPTGDIREGRLKKLQQKLDKAQEEQSRLQQELTRYRKENEELRHKATQWEHSFQERLEEELTRQRTEWYRRYSEAGTGAVEDARKELGALLERADRAFELQRQADERYGLISAIRQQLTRVDLYLEDIERIYAESLVITPEIARVKDALLKERKRLLNLPNIGKALQKDAPLLTSGDLRQKLRLLDPVPENLSKVARLQEIVSRLTSLGLLELPQPLLEEIAHKKRQIQEALYADFQPPQKMTTRDRHPRTFEDFVRSGASRQYDVYVDGYNILLKVQATRRITRSDFSLASFREDFIDAVHAKARHFKKIYLVFDGIEDFRDRRSNLEIIYVDKSRGATADSSIIEALRKRKDLQTLLVTADQEIIQATENHVYAVVNPYHFYLFVFEKDVPIHEGL